MSVIEGWRLLTSARYDDKGTEWMSVRWHTVDDRVYFWRSNGTWRSAASNPADKQQLNAAGIEPGDDLGLTLNEFVTLINSVIGCETALKRGTTIYTLEDSCIELMHDGDRRWYFVYGCVNEYRPEFNPAHQQACQEVRGPHRTRAVALRHLNNKLEELLSMPS